MNFKRITVKVTFIYDQSKTTNECYSSKKSISDFKVNVLIESAIN